MVATQSAKPSASVHMSCFVFDICEDHTLQLDFFARTRGVSISSPASPWARYFAAVYQGRAPSPFPLWKVNVWYSNNAQWRWLHPDAPSPFRECSPDHRVGTRCAPAHCEAWTAELRAQGIAAVPSVDLAALHWPMFEQRRVSGSLQLVHLVSADTDAFGRGTYANDSWVEVMRSDARPHFHEAQTPPECVGNWTSDAPYRLGQPINPCFARMAPMGGGPFPLGCWMRPVVGSGIWLNLGRTLVPSNADCRYPHVSQVDNTRVHLDAATRGFDTCQYAHGDPTTTWGGRRLCAPLIVVVRRECMGRLNGLRACVPSQLQLRSGWHDLPCQCVDAHLHLTLWSNEAAKEAFMEEWAKHFRGLARPPLPSNGKLRDWAGVLNCKKSEDVEPAVQLAASMNARVLGTGGRM